jgi:hypothetical protein
VDNSSDNERDLQRASDADRERAAAIVNEAMADGRLSPEEHSERLDAIYAAKTHGELVPVLKDITGAGPAPVAVQDRQPVTGRRDNIVAIFGGAVRKGRWSPAPDGRVATVFGGAELDYREADVPAQEIRLNCFTLFGGTSITVPPDMTVVDSGTAIFGGRDIPHDSAGDGTGPVLRLSGVTIFGGLSVRRKPRDA